MAKIVKKSPAPLYLAAAVWAAWAVLAPLYAWWHFALAAAVSAAAWPVSYTHLTLPTIA